MNSYHQHNTFEDDAEHILQSHSKNVPLISDEACFIVKWTIMGVLTSTGCCVGAVTNIINIICFAKEGLKDSVNVNFLGLAISDLGALVTLLFINISFIPTLEEANFSIDFVDLMYLTFGWPHHVFVRVSSWLTALITLERCLCITMPLKVKSFLTAERAALIIACMYIVFISCILPVYQVSSFGWKFSPERNRSIFGMVYTQDREEVEQVAHALNSVVLPFMAFIIVIVCTITLFISLRKKSEWRKKSTHGEQAQNISYRDQKVARMTVVIATIFIASYIPMCFIFIVMISVPGVSIDGPNKNVVIVVGGFCGLLEGINSSVNIFVYYHMSSKYRQTFTELFYCFHTSRVTE